LRKIITKLYKHLFESLEENSSNQNESIRNKIHINILWIFRRKSIKSKWIY